MGNYDDIALPVKGQPISSGAFGQKVRNAIIGMDARVSAIEGSLLPRYYVKSAVTTRSSTTTVAADSGGTQPLAGIPLEIGSYEIEFVGLWNLNTTGTQGLRTRWGFSGTVTNPVRNCLGTSDSGSGPNLNGTIMAQAYQATGQDASYFCQNTSSYVSLREICTGFVVTATGNFSINWAQAVSSANVTNLREGSYVRITRYA